MSNMDTKPPKIGALGQDVTGQKIVFNFDPMVAFGEAPAFWVESQDHRPLGKVTAVDREKKLVLIDPRPWEGELDLEDERTFAMPYERYSNDWKDRLE